jgi:hypothetical protein
MSKLFKLYCLCGCTNALFIGITNSYNGSRFVYKDYKKTIRRIDNAFEKVAVTISGIIILSFGMLGICATKTAFYFALGPIGTYRIWLASDNYLLSGNKKWINVLTKPGSSVSRRYYPFVIKPFGSASWIPIRMQKNHNE